MSVTKISDHTADPYTPVLEMEEHIRTVGEVQWALAGFAHLFSGEHTRDLDNAQIGCMVRALAHQLDSAHQELMECHEKAQRTTPGDGPRTGENDLRLCRLAEEYRSLESRSPDDEYASERQSAIVQEMLGIPADSVVGVAAKLAAVRESRPKEPEARFDKLEHRALAEIEQLGGFGRQQQAAE